MSVLTMMLLVLGLPALIAGLTAGVASWAGQRIGVASSEAGPASVALGLGAGIIAAQLVNAPPAYPPIDVTDRIPGLVLAATLLGVCEALCPSPGWARWENRVLLTLLVLGAILSPVLGPNWPAWQDLLRQGTLAFFLLFVWANLEPLAAARSTALAIPSLMVVAASTTAALFLSGSIVLGQIGAGLMAALAAVWVLSPWLSDRPFARGAIPVLVTTTTALLVTGHIYASLPFSAALLLGGASLASWAGCVGLARRLAAWQAASLGAAASLLIVTFALGLVIAAAFVPE
jgi:hypothetical protein